MQLISYMNNYLIFEKFQSGFRSNIALVKVANYLLFFVFCYYTNLFIVKHFVTLFWKVL